MQNHYNLVYREEEREMIPQCIDQGVAVLPVEPARARAARRQPDARRRAADDARAAPTRSATGCTRRSVDFAVVDRVAEVAAARGVPTAQVALAWLLAEAGRDRPDRRRDEGRAPRGRARRRAARPRADEVARLEEPYVPHAVSGHA